MNQNKAVTRARPSGMSHNVYCGYSLSDHNMLGSCRVMCSPLIRTANHTSSNPHQLTWSQLNTQKDAEEPFLDTAIGGIALAMLLIAMAFV